MSVMFVTQTAQVGVPEAVSRQCLTGESAVPEGQRVTARDLWE